MDSDKRAETICRWTDWVWTGKVKNKKEDTRILQAD